MERQKRIALHVGRNGGGGGRMDLHHVLVLLEHRLDHLINEGLRQVLVSDGKIEQTDRLIGPDQRRISASGNP